MRFNRFDWINFSYNDIGAQTFGTHCDTFTTPAVSCYNNIFTSYHQIGCTDNAIKGRLACAITVVEQVFAISVINRNHRKLQLSFFRQSFQTDNTCCRFLCASTNRSRKVRTFGSNNRCKVAAVINNQVGFNFQCTKLELFELFWPRIVFGIHCNTIFYKSRTYIILS
ncbi:hypothetical protein D3C76_1168300 [compost metagenome]